MRFPFLDGNEKPFQIAPDGNQGARRHLGIRQRPVPGTFHLQPEVLSEEFQTDLVGPSPALGKPKEGQGLHVEGRTGEGKIQPGVVVILSKEGNVKIVPPRGQPDLLAVPRKSFGPLEEGGPHLGESRLLGHHGGGDSRQFGDERGNVLGGPHQSLEGPFHLEFFIEVNRTQIDDAIVGLSSLVVLARGGLEVDHDKGIVKLEHGGILPQKRRSIQEGLSNGRKVG